MKNLSAFFILALATLSTTIACPAIAAAATEPQLAHNVYFSLNESSDAAKEKLIASCKKYLTGHPNVVYFAIATLAKDMKRPVNDQDFDVSIHIVFTNKAAHDTYNVSERHQKFVEENKASFKKVRVFDSYLEP